MNADRLAPGQRCASTGNRNFRQGRDALVNVASDANRMTMRRLLERLTAENTQTQVAE